MGKEVVFRYTKDFPIRAFDEKRKQIGWGWREMWPKLKYPESPVMMLYFACACEPPVGMVEMEASRRMEWACWKCGAFGAQIWIN